MHATPTRRGGFTLVELLVAVGIIAVLAALALLVANSGLITNIRTTGGSDRIAGWLMQARARAQRTGVPQGVRFIPDADGSGFIREAQLIEVPDPYIMPASPAGQPQPMLLIEQRQSGMGSTPPLKRLFVYAPTTSITDLTNSVSPGDTLSIPTLGTIHRVRQFTATPTFATTPPQVGWSSVQVEVEDWTKIPDIGAAALPPGPAPDPANPTYSTTTFGFIRQARPVFGEPSLQVSDTLAILINPANPDGSNGAGGLPLSLITQTQGNYDIVFAPNGEIQNAGGLGRMVLWMGNIDAVRAIGLPSAGGPRGAADNRVNYEQAGEMTLITVYTRTGAVAIHPVNMPAGAAGVHDPYAYTKDGIASGL